MIGLLHRNWIVLECLKNKEIITIKMVGFKKLLISIRKLSSMEIILFLRMRTLVMLWINFYSKLTAIWDSLSSKSISGSQLRPT